MTNKDFIKQAGGAAEGSYVVAMPLLNPASLKNDNPSKKVVEKSYNNYVAKYKEPPVGSASPAFDSGTILEAAVKLIKGPINRQSIRDALEQTSAIGTNGTFRFSPTNHSGLDEQGLTVVFVKIKGDGWVAE
jgi:branched-chain amino acid transport system substrate-binding protein